MAVGLLFVSFLLAIGYALVGPVSSTQTVLELGTNLRNIA